ncbi:CAP domain-containing protein [Streptomyces sp. NPDC006334]|uniref:CAP domain-containing protein n=1 Tax=Streptomyces sp. NPDC006334 TaxID=3156754 RepID=UPI0033AEF5D2
MGRHRRAAAARGAQDRHADGPVMGIAPYLNPEAYADSAARSHDYLYATDDDHARSAEDTAVLTADGFSPGGSGLPGSTRPGRGGTGRRRKRKAVTPVKTGLLGVSAAVALGTVAVASGVVPGLDGYKLGGNGGPSDRVTAADPPANSATEFGGTSGSAGPGAERGESSTSRDASRSGTPSASASAPASTPASPSPSASTASPSASPSTEKPTTAPTKQARKSAPSKPASKSPGRSSAAVAVSSEVQAAAEVLALVNEERSKVGCSPVAANSSLASLAQAFSVDMANRNFFDHTDPSGASPWDRAAKAGITDLGGENIARGQADAAAVMQAWMDSPGHRANILNCDFKTLGVGVHLGSGGPWWTQDFGY